MRFFFLRVSPESRGNRARQIGMRTIDLGVDDCDLDAFAG
jgi:hypothetical protein